MKKNLNRIQARFARTMIIPKNGAAVWLKALGGIVSAIILTMTPAAAHAAAFTPGNIVVYRIGTGSGALSSVATAAFLDEYTTSGTYVQSIALPTAVASSGNRAMTCSGSAASEGELTLSPDGQYLACVGYNAAPGATGVAATSNNGGGSDVNRVVGRIDASGTVDSSTALIGTSGTPLYTGNNIRAALVSGSSVYSAGANTPSVGYSTFGGNTAVALLTSSTSVRSVHIFGGNLYFDTSSACSEFSGLPTASATPTTFTFSGTAPSSAEGFVFVDVGNSGSVNTAYFADGTKLRKYSLSGTTLTAQGTATIIGSGLGLTASVSGSTVTIFTTGNTGSHVIQKTVDASGTGATLTATPTTLVLTGNPVSANYSFQGIAFAPVAYTVTYNGNGNTGSTAPVDGSSPYASGATVTVKTVGSLTKTGYTFTGWNTQANGGGTSYAANATFTIAANTTLFAQWTANTYTVTYNGNGSTGGSAPTDASSPYTSGATVTVLNNTGSLVKTGYTFAGWNTAADGSGTSYAAGATFIIAANTTLFAQWTINTYTVTYNGNGNTGGTAPVDGSSPYNYNSTVTVLGAGTLTKTGSTFAGWNTAADGSGTSYSAGGSILNLAANVTLFAQWTSSPSISGGATTAAFTTTYGTASAAQTFAVSGVNLTTDLIATAPTGFEVSSDGSSYGTTATFTQSSGNAGGTLSIRLKAAAVVSGSYNSQNIVLSSTGASSVNIATASTGNSVTAKGLTITGLTGSDKPYDQTTVAAFTGTPAYSGLVNGESFTVSGAGSASFVTATAGTAKTINVTGYTTPSVNYTLTQPTLSANIIPLALTVTGATVTTKAFDGTTNAAITGESLVGVINPDVVTVGGGGYFADTNANTGIAVTAALTLGGGDSTNYSLTQPTGLTGTITQANQTITFNTLPGKNTNDAPFTLSATASSGLAVSYSSGNISVATISGNTVTIVGSGSTTITATNAGNGNFNPASATQTLNVGTPLSPGDLAVIAFGPSGTDKLAVVLLKAVVAGTTIVFTDNGFTNATTGRTGEGFLTYAAPADQPAGTVLTWQNGQSITGTGWNSAAPSGFALNASGEQLFAFQGDTSNWASQSGIKLLYGIQTAVAWLTAGPVDSSHSFAPDPGLLPSAYLIQFTTKSDVFLTATTIANTAANIITAVTTLGDYTTANSAQTLPVYSQFTVLIPTTVTVQSSANPSGYSNSVNFVATNLPATATGNIIFLTNGTAFDTEALNNGGTTSAATLTLPRGTNTITAQYAGDANYLGSTNDLSGGQIVTNHPPVANVSSYSRPSGFTLKIPVPGSLSTNWSDVDGDAVTLSGSISSTDGATVSYDSNFVYYSDPNNVADQVNYTVSDGHGGTAAGVINLTIAPASTNQTQNITGSSYDSGANTYTISFASVPNSTNVVERTLNLATPVWTAISTNVAGANGLWQFIDTNPPNPTSYYRSKRQP